MTCWRHRAQGQGSGERELSLSVATTLTIAESTTATSIAASTLGTTSRWMGEMPSTSSAAISSRMVRAPRSAQIAEPPAPAISSAVTTGAAWGRSPARPPTR